MKPGGGFVLEVNPRASRTVPVYQSPVFLSKTGQGLTGRKPKELGYRRLNDATLLDGESPGIFL